MQGPSPGLELGCFLRREGPPKGSWPESPILSRSLAMAVGSSIKILLLPFSFNGSFTA